METMPVYVRLTLFAATLTVCIKAVHYKLSESNLRAVYKVEEAIRLVDCYPNAFEGCGEVAKIMSVNSDGSYSVLIFDKTGKPFNKLTVSEHFIASRYKK